MDLSLDGQMDGWVSANHSGWEQDASDRQPIPEGPRIQIIVFEGPNTLILRVFGL